MKSQVCHKVLVTGMSTALRYLLLFPVCSATITLSPRQSQRSFQRRRCANSTWTCISYFISETTLAMECGKKILKNVHRTCETTGIDGLALFHKRHEKIQLKGRLNIFHVLEKAGGWINFSDPLLRFTRMLKE